MVPWCMTAWTEQSWTAWRVSCLLNLYDSPAGSGAQPGFGVPLSRDITPVTRLARGSRPNRAVRGDRSPGPGNRPEPPAGASAA